MAAGYRQCKTNQINQIFGDYAQRSSVTQKLCEDTQSESIDSHLKTLNQNQ